MLGKIEAGGEGNDRVKWLDGIMDSTDKSLNKPGHSEAQGGRVC